MSAFLRLPVSQRKRPQSFGCSHWKKYRCSKRRSCVISCSFIHFLTFSVIGSVLLAFPPSTIWYFLWPVLACLVWQSPLITWRSELLELFAGQGASLLPTEPMFDRKHEFFFLFSLGGLTQRPVLTLSNLHRGLSQLTEQALTEQALVCRKSCKMLSF